MIKIVKGLYIHFLTPCLFAICYITGKLETLFISYIIMLLHELAHLLGAVVIGLKPARIVLYPFGVNLKLKNSIETFKDYQEQIQNIEQENDLKTLFRKINLIIDVNDKLKYNVNVNMLMDKFIIEFSGGE